MSKFSERIKELRIKNDLTQEELGRRFLLNKSSVSRYERGQQVPEVDMLTKLADYFGVTTDYLLGRTDDPGAYVISGDEIPKELKDLGVEELGVEAEVKKHGLSKEDIEEIIEFIRFKGQKK